MGRERKRCLGMASPEGRPGWLWLPCCFWKLLRHLLLQPPSGFDFLRQRLSASALLPARPAHQRLGPFARVSRGVKCSAPIKARVAAGWGLGTCLKGAETLWKEPRSALIPGFALELFNLSFKMPRAGLRGCKGKSTYDSQSQDE